MSQPGPSGLTRADARLNRDRLLTAAREVLAERGFQAEVADIAARAGIGTGTIYRNYPNKEALLLEIAREIAAKTSPELLRIAAHVKDARECVAQTMQVGFARVKEYGQFAVELVSGNVPPPFDTAVNHNALADVFALLIQRGIDQGSFRRDLNVSYAVAAWFALVAPQTARTLTEHLSIDEIAEHTTQFFLAGIAAPSSDEKGSP